MADQFLIEIRDTVDPKIREKLLSIALAALDIQINIEKAQKALSGLGTGSLDKIIGQEDKLANAANRSSEAYLRQETALHKAIQAENNAAISANKLAEAEAKANAATLNNISASERLATTAQKRAIVENQLAISTLNGLTAQERLATAAARTSVAQNQLAKSQLDGLAAAERLATAQQRLAIAENQLAISSVNGLTASERLAAAQNKTAQSATSAAIADQKLIVAQNQVAASALNGLTASERLIAAQNNSAAAQQKLAAASAGTAAAQSRAQAAATGAATAQQRLSIAISGAATAQVRGATAATQNATAQARLAQATAQAAAAQLRLQSLQSGPSNTAASFAGLLDGLNKLQYRLFAIYALYQSLYAVISRADAYTNLQNKLQMVADTQTRVNSLTIELLDVANRARAPLGAVSETFNRINSAIKVYGGSTTEALKITETLTKATTAYGLTASEQASALLQVSQAFNKGKLDGDEFRSVMENFPQLGDALAQALGLANKGLLFDASKEGKINLDVMRRAMELLAVSADQQLGKATITVDNAITQLSNTTTVLIGVFDKALGASERLAKGISNFTGYVTRLIKEYQKLKGLEDQAANPDKNESFRKSEREFTSNQLSKDAAERAKAVSGLTEIFTNAKVGGQKLNAEVKLLNDNLKVLNSIPIAQRTAKETEAIKIATENRAKILESLERANTYKAPKTPKGPKYSEEELRATTLAKVTAEIDKQIHFYDLVAEKRIVQQRLTQIDIDLAARHRAKLSPTEKTSITKQLEEAEKARRITAALDQVVEHANGPARKFADTLKAIGIALKSGEITNTQASEAIKRNSYEYEQAVNPLANLNKELKQHIDLLGFSARARQVESEIIQINNSLAPLGRQLTNEQTAAYRRQFEAMQRVSEKREALDRIEDETFGTRRRLVDELEATVIAFDKGSISADVYSNKLANLTVAASNISLSQGFGTFEDVAMSSIGRVLEGYTNAAQGISQAFGTAFVGISDGISSTLGRAIVMGDSLQDSLGNAARTIASDLIGALIKVGIQYVINSVLAETAASAVTVASAGLAATTATAWAPAAAAVSLATSGANAIPAMEGMFAANLVSRALALGGFEQGGYTGDYGLKEIAGLVHGREFVVNARATAQNRPVLEAMNRGASPSVGNFKLNITNTGTPKEYEVVGVTEDTVRIIARDMVAKHAPSVIAGDLNNPNSATSKSIRNNTMAARKR